MRVSTTVQLEITTHLTTSNFVRVAEDPRPYRWAKINCDWLQHFCKVWRKSNKCSCNILVGVGGPLRPAPYSKIITHLAEAKMYPNSIT